MVKPGASGAVVDRFSKSVRVDDGQTVRESAVHFELERVVESRLPVRYRGRSGPAEEFIQRLACGARSRNLARIDVDVIICPDVDAVIADEGPLDRKVARQRPLDGDVPRLDIGYWNVFRFDEVVLIRRVGDDAVRRDDNGLRRGESG